MQKAVKVLAGVLSVSARILLCAVFLAAALGYTAPDVNSFARTIGGMATVAPTWISIGAIALLVAGSLSVAVGYKARFGALALLIPGADDLSLSRFHVLERGECPGSPRPYRLPRHEPIDHGGHALHSRQWGRPDEPRCETAVNPL